MDLFNIVGITSVIFLIASMPVAAYLDVRSADKSFRKVKDEAERWLREEKKTKYVLDIEMKGETVTVDAPEPYYEIYPYYSVNSIFATRYGAEDLARKEAQKVFSQEYFHSESTGYVPVSQIKRIVTRRKT